MAAYECGPSEDDRVARLMESLPSEYDALFAAINVSTQMSSQEISLNYLIGAIKSEALRIGVKTTKPNIVALNATKTTKLVKKKIDKKNDEVMAVCRAGYQSRRQWDRRKYYRNDGSYSIGTRSPHHAH